MRINHKSDKAELQNEINKEIDSLRFPYKDKPDGPICIKENEIILKFENALCPYCIEGQEVDCGINGEKYIGIVSNIYKNKLYTLITMSNCRIENKITEGV